VGRARKIVEKTKQLKEQKTKVEPEVPTEVWVDTKGEVVFVNGKKFQGRQLVPTGYSTAIKRIVEERKRQRVKEKEATVYPDKHLGVIGGGRR